VGACRCTGGTLQAPDSPACADAWTRLCRELITSTLFHSVQPDTLARLVAATRHGLPQVREIATLCVAQLQRIDPGALARLGLLPGTR
jgi:ABC-type transporter Mla MlaB component